MIPGRCFLIGIFPAFQESVQNTVGTDGSEGKDCSKRQVEGNTTWSPANFCQDGNHDIAKMIVGNRKSRQPRV